MSIYSARRSVAFGLGLLLLAGCAGLFSGARAAAASAPRWASLSDTTFTNFTQEAGLPGALATTVAEDGDGFLWVGTQSGLARWDGYHFKVYKPDAKDPGSLPDNWIQVLHTDPKGRLWVGTNGGALARYEAATDNFKTIAVGAKGQSHVLVHSIGDDGYGGLWVGSDGGLVHVAAGTDAVEHVPLGAGTNVLRSHATAVMQDHAGGLWVGTQDGLLHRAPGSNAAFEQVVLDATAGAPVNSVRAVLEDSKGQIWAGTMGQGAWVVDPASGTAKPLRATPPASDSIEQDRVLAISEVAPGHIWLGTFSNGVVAVDLATLHTQQLQNNKERPSSLPSNTVWALHTQPNGLVWIAHGRGLSRYNPSQAAVLTVWGAAGNRNGLSDEDITSVLPTPDGHIWLGLAKNGVDVVDPLGARVAELRPGTTPATSLAKDFVWNMVFVPAAQQVYLGTLRGLYRADLAGKGLTRMSFSRTDPGDSVDAQHLDGNTLWMGSWSDGLWQLNVADPKAEPQVLRHVPGERFTDRRINAIQKATDGALWVGTAAGLNRYDPANDTVEQIAPEPASGHGLGKGSITSLLLDPNGRLWVSTLGGGIAVMTGRDAKGVPQFKTLAMQQGLPDNNVDKLLLDAAGMVWASTDDGLAQIDPVTFGIRALRREDGVQIAAYWGGAGARTADNELLFGGGGGLSIVRPELLSAWNFAAPLVVTNTWVGDKSVPSQRLSASGKAPLVVQANANSLSVEFAALDLSAPERNLYAYKLDGFDVDWKSTDASRRIAAYTNLPPGDYTLRMRGSNRNGVFTEQTLPITVQPAWYQTVWFRLVAVLCAALTVWLIVLGYTSYLRQAQVVLEAKVAERTASLKAATRALEEKSKALEEASLTDPLTGMRNRRFLQLNLEADIALHLRHHESAALTHTEPQDADLIFFLIDIDHFKQVNDVYGHAAGDAVLTQMRQRMQRVFRDSDFLVRWGGEEFLVVARGTHRNQGETLAERMRQSVCSEPFILDDGRPLTKSCSLGFACFPFFLSDPAAVPWTDVVEVADAALYGAKRAGRDGWVGVAANEEASRAGFMARTLADFYGAALAGDVVLVSSRESAAVLAGLVSGRA